MANKTLALGILAMVTKYSQRACLNSSGIKEPKLLERMPTKRRGITLSSSFLSRSYPKTVDSSSGLLGKSVFPEERNFIAA